MVARGGRSKEGGNGGASGRAELVSERWDEEEGGYDNCGLQPDKYLDVTWADRPPLQSGPSGGRVFTDVPVGILALGGIGANGAPRLSFF